MRDYIYGLDELDLNFLLMYYLSQDKWKCRFAKYHSSIGSLKPIINVAIKPKI